MRSQKAVCLCVYALLCAALFLPPWPVTQDLQEMGHAASHLHGRKDGLWSHIDRPEAEGLPLLPPG